MALQQFQEQASLEKGDSPRGGEMPAGQRGPLSTRGTGKAGGGILLKSFTYSFKSLSQACGLPAPFSREPHLPRVPREILKQSFQCCTDIRIT